MSSTMRCPVCDGAAREFLRRSGVPVHQNLVLATRAEALEVARGELALTACEQCGFVFNASFDPSRLQYGEDYDNTQSHSPFFAAYMKALADHLIHDEGVVNSRIVEVGCGKGVFLRMLVADAANGNSGAGFDPSYVGPDSDLDGRLRFERRFYDEACASEPADVVVCRHVIEHVPAPLDLLRAVRGALRSARAPRIYFETPCVEWILRNNVIWDFFYEHCSLFTAASLSTAFERAGFAVAGVTHVFGGQYLWLEAALSDGPREPRKDPGSIPALARAFAREQEHLRERWRARLERLRAGGKVAVWGAGAKGTTFAHLVDPRGDLIDCLVDLNPNKQGRFVPGTGHPIVGVGDLAARGIGCAILMNPNYRAENEALLQRGGLRVELIE